MFWNNPFQAWGFSSVNFSFSQEEWLEVRADFSARAKSSQGQAIKEDVEESVLPQGFEFLADKVTITED